MERLTQHTAPGMDADALRNWGIFFLAAGIVGRGVLQTWVLGLGRLTMVQMLELMSASQQAMILVTTSLVLQAVETCAIPIFAVLLVEGAQHTRSLTGYLGRVAVLAVVSEIPYNLAFHGSFWNTESRNPAFGMALCLVMVWFYVRYGTPGAKNMLIKGVVTAAALLWSRMLAIDHGAALVVVTAVLWLMRKKPMYRNFAGMAAAVVCTMFSPFYLAAPMGFLAVHGYNGTREEGGSRRHYLWYPALLAVAAIAGMLIMA